MIQSSDRSNPDLPQVLHRRHLLWMCDQIESHADDWPATRLHCWIGFIQGGMLANGMLDFDAVKKMFDDAKVAYGAGEDDEDLMDHLDPANSFQFDLGGQGWGGDCFRQRALIAGSPSPEAAEMGRIFPAAESPSPRLRRFPSRKASAIVCGISASASGTRWNRSASRRPGLWEDDGPQGRGREDKNGRSP